MKIDVFCLCEKKCIIGEICKSTNEMLLCADIKLLFSNLIVLDITNYDVKCSKYCKYYTFANVV